MLRDNGAALFYAIPPNACLFLLERQRWSSIGDDEVELSVYIAGFYAKDTRYLLL